MDPYRVLASLEEPPKSDRSHYPKYKPLIFPAAQHDSANPEYTGPLIQTPRIKPCGAGVPETCWPEPLFAPTVATTNSCESVASTTDGQQDISHARDKLPKSKDRKPPVKADVCTCDDHDDDNAQCTGMHHTQGALSEVASASLSGSETREGVPASLCHAVLVIPRLSLSSVDRESIRTVPDCPDEWKQYSCRQR